MRTTIDRIGKYELRAPLARTPTSTVYDAWDSVIARRVALKLMPLSTVEDFDEQEAFARFKRGAQAAGQLNHPNIVAVYDYGETDSYAYLVMEFVGGSTLKDVFDGNQRFALPEICRVVVSILEALQYSHDRGVVHRDVKPANIMLTTEKQVKITDFGIARLEDSQITQAGMVIGTPAYMSPEQFLGENTDWRTDIYSAGVVLYQMLTGERPYEGNLATIMHKVLYGSPLLPSRVSTLVTPALDAVVTKAMARNRDDRFQTASEFGAALRAASVPAAPRVRKTAADGQAHPSYTKSSYTKSSGTKSSGSPARVLAFGTVVAAVLAAGGWYAYDKLAPQSNNGSSVQHDLLQQARTREDQARQQQEQARAQQAQEAARQQQLAQRQQEEAARQLQAQLQQEQEERQRQQAAQLQQQEEARQQQEAQRQRDLLARRQQEQAQARLQQQQDDQARLLRQQQEQARQKREQARQDQEQARIKQDQARQKQAQDQGRPKLDPAETSPKPGDNELLGGGVLRPSYPVTSTSGAVGLVCVSVTADTAGRFGLQSPQGMIVTGVLTGGAAERAGIRPDDVILKVKGSEISDLSMLAKIASDGPPGQTVPVEVIRQGNRRVLQLSMDALRH